mgnify:CR=1 FL=1
MKVRIDPDLCTGCGLCSDSVPDVFKMGDDIAEVIAADVPANLESAVRIFLEFLQGFESMEVERPCVTVFGSARIGSDDPVYADVVELGRGLAEAADAGVAHRPADGLALVERGNDHETPRGPCGRGAGRHGIRRSRRRRD